MLDTHAVVKELMKAGFDEAKAEAIVQAQLKLITKGLVTKADLFEVSSELKADIAKLDKRLSDVYGELKTDVASLRTELKADIAELDKRLSDVHGELKADIARLDKRLSDVHGELKADNAKLDKRLSDIHGELKDEITMLRLEMERRSGRVNLLLWVVIVLVVLSSPTASRILERLLSLAV